MLFAQRQRMTEDRELTDLDVSGWDCLNKPEGTAKSDDGAERNRLKNRSAPNPPAAVREGAGYRWFLEVRRRFRRADKEHAAQGLESGAEAASRRPGKATRVADRLARAFLPGPTGIHKLR